MLSAEFLETVDVVGIIEKTQALIAPYVEKDPSKFCTYEEFETGAATLAEFCRLRIESVEGQLAGTIPSTSEGQTADSSTLIDASGITISDMGSMNMGSMNMGGDLQDKDNVNGFPDGGNFGTIPDGEGAGTMPGGGNFGQ